MSKEKFKLFIRSNPSIGKYVLNGNSSWQKLYETYVMYGETSSIWDEYKVSDKDISVTEINPNTTVKDIFSSIKNVDLDTVQKGVVNLQKTIGLLQDLGVGSATNNSTNYEARPMYKYFED